MAPKKVTRVTASWQVMNDPTQEEAPEQAGGNEPEFGPNQEAHFEEEVNNHPEGESQADSQPSLPQQPPAQQQPQPPAAGVPGAAVTLPTVLEAIDAFLERRGLNRLPSSSCQGAVP